MKVSLRNNEKGSALVVTMVALLVLSILSTAILSVAARNYTTSITESEFQSSYYIAEAGAVYYMEAFRKHVNDSYTSTTSEASFFTAVETGYLSTTIPLDGSFFEASYGSTPPAATITLQRLDPTQTNPRTYAMVSTGTIDNSQRKVIKTFLVKYTPLIDLSNLMTVFSQGQMTLSNGTINGPIGTNMIGTNAINVTGWPTIGDYYLASGATIGKPSPYWTSHGSSQVLTSSRSYPMPLFPSFPLVSACTSLPSVYRSGGELPYTISLTEDLTYISTISILSDRVVNIDPNGGNRTLMIDDLNMPQGRLNIVGSGTLSIYVRGNITITNGSVINMPASGSAADVKAAVERLAFYVQGASDPTTDKSISLSGSNKIYGSLYAEDANLDIAAGAGFQGNVYTGGTSVSMSGGTSVTTNMIYAPNAAVFLTGGAIVNGPIISKSFYMDGGAKIQYNSTTSPIYQDPITGGGTSNLIQMESPLREK